MLLLSRETDTYSSMLTEPELPQECNRYVTLSLSAHTDDKRRRTGLCGTDTRRGCLKWKRDGCGDKSHSVSVSV